MEQDIVRPYYWAKAKITHTMANSRTQGWESILGPIRDEIKRVLEIGSYEGQSALFWHGFLNAHVTCIDNWKHVADGCANAREVERHFDNNTRGLRITKMKVATSTDALVQLIRDKVSFDLAYIDGDHSRLQVMIDTCLAWRLLRSGGIMVWDDYEEYRPDLVDRPTPAIDAFNAFMQPEIIFIENTGQQLIVRKC
jgi:predicted O-methyltransferase YrrM